jgi:hypothetical protein
MSLCNYIDNMSTNTEFKSGDFVEIVTDASDINNGRCAYVLIAFEDSPNGSVSLAVDHTDAVLSSWSPFASVLDVLPQPPLTSTVKAPTTRRNLRNEEYL